MASLVRFPREDSNDFVLLLSQQTGLAVLDLRLVATDGQNPFTTDLKQNALNRLRSSQFRGPDQEWVAIVKAILCPSPDDPLIQGLEAVASVTADAITVSIQKNITGIIQRLGSISLTLNEEEPIELFDWAGIAAQTANDHRNQLLTIQQSMETQRATIQRLTAQLDDLVAVKKLHEDELLNKFTALLNSKKLKIRDQQRLLAHAKVDPHAATQVQQSRSKPSRKPSPSRAGKRKALQPLDDDDDETDDDENPSKPGNCVNNDGDGDADRMTPEDKSELDETDDGGAETEDDDFAPAPAPSQSLRHSQPSRQRKEPQSKTPVLEDVAIQQPPPRRELPFAKKNVPNVVSHKAGPASDPKPPVAAPITEDDETEDETDDEL